MVSLVPRILAYFLESTHSQNELVHFLLLMLIVYIGYTYWISIQKRWKNIEIDYEEAFGV